MEFDLSLGSVFGTISKDYDSAREDYPKELFENIVHFVPLTRQSRVLEVGCGSGIATVPLAQIGVNLTAIDPSIELMEIARKKTSTFPNVQYRQGSFENVYLEPNSFDLVTAAQAWHWVDPNVAYKRAHKVLKDNGALALFWKFQDDRMPLVSELRELFVKHCPKFPVMYHDLAPTIEKIDKSRLFGPVQKIDHLTQRQFSRESYEALIKTYSWVRILPLDQQRDFLRDLSGLLERRPESFSVPYNYPLLLSRKK